MNNQTDFYLKRLSPLMGGQIIGSVRTGTDEYGDEFFGLTIKKKNGKTVHLLLLSDDEGNGPGSFQITPEE